MRKAAAVPSAVCQDDTDVGLPSEIFESRVWVHGDAAHRLSSCSAAESQFRDNCLSVGMHGCSENASKQWPKRLTALPVNFGKVQNRRPLIGTRLSVQGSVPSSDSE